MGVILIDTRIGEGNAFVDQSYRPQRHAIAEQLRAPPLGTLQAAADDDVRRATKALLPLVSLLGWCNLTGQPAISLPLSTSPTGLPIGIQLVAPYGREDRLLAVAAQLETAAPWSARHPPDNTPTGS